MIFYTHRRPLKTRASKTLKPVLTICYTLIIALFLFSAVAISVISKSILPALVILIPMALIVAFILITTSDMRKAYVEVNERSVTAVDYYFFFRRERTFSVSEIAQGEIAIGNSFRVRGYRHSVMGVSYIVFRDDSSKYLFKIISCPETNEYFDKYLK